MEQRMAPREDWVRRARLKRAVDGDTLWVVVDSGFGASMTVELRLKDVDTKEIVGVDRFRATVARDELAALCDHQWLTVQTYKTRNDTDVRSFTRWVADVWLEDGTHVPTWLVEQGHAVWVRV